MFESDSNVDGFCKCINVITPTISSFVTNSAVLLYVMKLASSEKIGLENVWLAVVHGVKYFLL